MLFQVFSDGASFNNGYKDKTKPQIASCGLVITSEEKIIKKAKKIFPDKTISYAELKGSILVLDLLKKSILDKYDIEKPYKIELYSDSQFVIKGINEWMKNWLKSCNDWKKDIWYNSSGNVVGQYELFREMKLKYLDNPDFDIKFIHIKGHTKKQDFFSTMNETCDKIASNCLNQYLKNNNLK